MNVAIIPARSGSKRIPGKNVRRFAGRPMIAWPIEAARESGLFDRILVSTDDDAVAAAAAEAGAEVPFRRPAELADDYCGTLEVISHAAHWAAAQDWPLTGICCLYATAPFVVPEDLRRGRDALRDGGWDYVFAAGAFRHSPWRGFVRSAQGNMELVFPEHRLSRSQDLAAVYYDAGQFYWGTAEAWLGLRPIFGSRTSFVELPPWRAQDIDTPEDWTMAEHLFEILRRTSDGQ